MKFSEEQVKELLERKKELEDQRDGLIKNVNAQISALNGALQFIEMMLNDDNKEGGEDVKS